jgi:hypothetical protein
MSNSSFDGGNARGGDGARGLHDRRSSSDDTPMTGRYVAVVVLEAIIIAALWALGRMYS